MRLLVDTDIFCKLGVAGLLNEALAALGVSSGECGRLPALPHMLQRGGIVKRCGSPACNALVPVAMEMPIAPAADDKWLQPLVGVASIDAGEAQLLALTAQHAFVLLSGDKRALRSVATVGLIVPALEGKIVTFEAILLVLCERLGLPAVRKALQPLAEIDQTVKVCFSPGNVDPVAALKSYQGSLQQEVAPMNLWKPSS